MHNENGARDNTAVKTRTLAPSGHECELLHCEFISDADHRRFITNRFIIYRSNCIGTLFCSKDNMNEIIWFCYRHIQWFSVYQYNFCLLYNVRCF